MFAQQELWTRAVPEGAALTAADPDAGLIVNDLQSQLNPTRVSMLTQPAGPADLQHLVSTARARGLSIAVAGGRHAMGGQQFATGALQIDTSRLTRVLALDRQRGLVTVESGILWPQLIHDVLARQPGEVSPWTIRQKQTGADRLSIGGALASNIHGRGLAMAPIIGDVESFTYVDAQGEMQTCSRTRRPEMFRLIIGGYGLFGIVYAVTLRLARRHRLVRRVEVRAIDGLMDAFDQRIADGFEYGDFQFATDSRGDGFLRDGVFSCYAPTEEGDRGPGAGQKVLTLEEWKHLAYLAHVDKAAAFRLYASHYLATDGRVYWSDTHQLAEYLDEYHAALDPVLPSGRKATEVITELYVPRAALTSFMRTVREDFRRHDVDLIYGTIRLVERDTESALAWAREPWACVIFNLHTEHSSGGIERSAADFRRLIDRAIDVGGSYYLTYHRWATQGQALACHPGLPEVLQRKREMDPDERFQSDWYRHHREMFD